MEKKTCAAWSGLLEPAALDPNGPAMDELLALARQTGVSGLQSCALRQASAALLQQHAACLSPQAGWLLGRLQNAGFQPVYPTYLGLDLLGQYVDAGGACESSAGLARATLRLIAELVLQLLEVDELQAHPGRSKLEVRAAAIVRACQEHVFAPQPAAPPERSLVQLSLLPESGNPDELIFIRVLQGSELVFGAAGLLAGRALAAVGYGEYLAALEDLHWAASLSEMIVPFLGLLAPMSVESWQQLRPFVISPSAIQSTNFHHLNAELGEVRRILGHPRGQRRHQRYLPLLQELLDEANSNFQTWERGHRAIATKYSPGVDGSKTEGVAWLESRPQPFGPPLGPPFGTGEKG